MRLLILSTEFPPGPGGIGTQAYQLARHLHRIGWEVLVITSQDYVSKADWQRFNEEQPFKIIRLHRTFGLPLKAVYRLWIGIFWLLRWKPDAILATGQAATWLAALLTRFLGPQTWAAVGHGTEFELGPTWRLGLTRWAFRQASAVVAVSQYTWERMQNIGIDPQSGTVIPNGGDLDQFVILPDEQKAQLRKDWKLENTHLILTVGNVTRRKGQDVVIRALPTVLKHEPNTRYFVVGLPTLRQEFAGLAQELGVIDSVEFLGRVENEKLVQLFNLSDLFVMTSRHTSNGDVEGYGIAVIEAAMCGIPSVVTVNSGLTEVIISGETGLSIEQDNPAAAAQAIIELLTDDTRRQAMGQAAWKRSHKEQAWETSAQSYHLLLCKLLDK